MFDAMAMKARCVRWIREFFEQNGPGCNAVIGISGGKDSSVAAALCVEEGADDRNGTTRRSCPTVPFRFYAAASSMFSMKMPYPVVGSLTRTWVTAPTSLPSWMMGLPDTSVSI